MMMFPRVVRMQTRLIVSADADPSRLYSCPAVFDDIFHEAPWPPPSCCVRRSVSRIGPALGEWFCARIAPALYHGDRTTTAIEETDTVPDPADSTAPNEIVRTVLGGSRQ
jgi:hypothetical protein